ncbi:hypothetical protein [Aporhodopirellula aestuarii]|uniref:Uncharacterized protein n=1 Tax=Aporhodopirellula aestuarii TaxID=2950107 RepID=A0ABT0UEB0_9BACT|nr:hypothetical protein [Aporhodopirellula aestuarii]MCM2375050.1 hypothetical protein [Aporhodopirellula aestuarii]
MSLQNWLSRPLSSAKARQNAIDNSSTDSPFASALLASSRFCIVITMLAYTVAMTGCAKTAPPVETPAADHDHDHDDDGHDHEHDDHDHDHDGHDHDHDHADIDVDSLMPIDAPDGPESLSAGIDQLVSMRDTIAKGFADDDVDSIHDQLHSVGGLLEHLEEMTKSSDLPDDAKEQAADAIDSLFDAFGDVDAKLHGDTGAEYSDVSDKIDSAVKTLSELELPQS